MQLLPAWNVLALNCYQHSYAPVYITIIIPRNSAMHRVPNVYTMTGAWQPLTWCYCCLSTTATARDQSSPCCTQCVTMLEMNLTAFQSRAEGALLCVSVSEMIQPRDDL